MMSSAWPALAAGLLAVTPQSTANITKPADPLTTVLATPQPVIGDMSTTDMLLPTVTTPSFSNMLTTNGSDTVTYSIVDAKGDKKTPPSYSLTLPYTQAQPPHGMPNGWTGGNPNKLDKMAFYNGPADPNDLDHMAIGDGRYSFSGVVPDIYKTVPNGKIFKIVPPVAPSQPAPSPSK